MDLLPAQIERAINLRMSVVNKKILYIPRFEGLILSKSLHSVFLTFNSTGTPCPNTSGSYISSACNGMT